MEENNTNINAPKGMTVEQRQEYNKKYYSEHKESIINDLCQKVKCDRCQSEVTKARLGKHKMSKICSKRATDLFSTLEFLNNILNKRKQDQENMNMENNMENIKNLLKIIQKL